MQERTWKLSAWVDFGVNEKPHFFMKKWGNGTYVSLKAEEFQKMLQVIQEHPEVFHVETGEQER